MFTLVILYTLYTLFILFTHVYPNHTVYPVYPYISCVLMFTQVILYTLCTPKLTMQGNYEIGKTDWSGIELWSTISDPHPSTQCFTVNHHEN